MIATTAEFPSGPAFEAPALASGLGAVAVLLHRRALAPLQRQPVDVDLNEPQRLAWERQILARAATGERAAWSALYDQFANLLFSRVLMPKLGNRAAAEDALSETFRTAIERIEQFEPRGASVYFWLARIAANKATDMFRARGVSSRAVVNMEAQLLPLLDSPITPEHALDCKKQYTAVGERLGSCLQRINPRYRRAIELRFFEELSREQCAVELDVKLGTFDVLLLRALKALRKQWDEQTAAAGQSLQTTEFGAQ